MTTLRCLGDAQPGALCHDNDGACSVMFFVIAPEVECNEIRMVYVLVIAGASGVPEGFDDWPSDYPEYIGGARDLVRIA